MGACVTKTLKTIREQGWGATGPQLAIYQNLMAELGVSDKNLDAAIARAQDENVIGAKISGSGLGDCVVALGACPKGFTPAPLAPQGVIFHDPS